MPFGLSPNLWNRIWAALALLPVVLGAIVYGSYFYALLLAVGGILMAYEWQMVTHQRSVKTKTIIIFMGTIGAILYGEFIGTLDRSIGASLVIVSLLSLVFALIYLIIEAPKEDISAKIEGQVPVETDSSEQENKTKIAPDSSKRWSFAGAPYIAMAILSLSWLRTADDYGLTVMWLFFCVWAMDVGGYFAGKSIGGPKLAPRISPSKTWSGLVGGMVLAGVTSVVFAVIADWHSFIALFFVGMLIAVIAQIGDLFESYVKRKFNTKDSGGLIPGHGGILDRVDGLIFAAPAVAIGLSVLQLAGYSDLLSAAYNNG